MYIKRERVANKSEQWIQRQKTWITNFVEECNHDINQSVVLSYLSDLREEYSDVTYAKIFFTIRCFLRFLGVSYAQALQAPKVRHNHNISIYRSDDIVEAYHILEDCHTRRYCAGLLLAATSGIRAEELYNLNRDDIDIEQRIVYVNKSKTGRRRVVFFNEEAQQELKKYFSEDSEHNPLFAKSPMLRNFRKTDLRPKHLRKFFSQEWDRQGGPTTIKKILMGHSLKGDVDLNHYNAQSEEDLKQIYDNVNITVLP